MLDVLFLDIDHTLHASDAYLCDGRVTAGSPVSSLFEFAPILARLIAPYPSLVIILSSSWVHVLGYAYTVAQLPTTSLQARVRGATFESDDAADDNWPTLPRGVQVLRFVRRHRLRHWLAIDDMRAGFEGYEAQLVHCQIGVVFGDKDVQKLFADRLATMFGIPGLVPESGMPGAPADGDR